MLAGELRISCETLFYIKVHVCLFRMYVSTLKEHHRLYAIVI